MVMTSALENPVLVLNRSWIPIGTTTVRDGFSTVIAERAKFVCPETFGLFDFNSWIDQEVREKDQFVTAVRQRIRAPEVLVNEYNRLPKQKVNFSRRNLWKRDQWRCQYCGKHPQSDEITVDHVIPKSLRHTLPPGVELSSFVNCVLACVDCNTKKDNRTLARSGMRLRRMVPTQNGLWKPVFYDCPRVPSWSPLYSVRRQLFPKSWAQFLRQKNDELYWNVELED